jgi:hypothetical protein
MDATFRDKGVVVSLTPARRNGAGVKTGVMWFAEAQNGAWFRIGFGR